HALARTASVRAAGGDRRAPWLGPGVGVRQGLPRLAVPADAAALRLAFPAAGYRPARAHGRARCGRCGVRRDAGALAPSRGWREPRALSLAPPVRDAAGPARDPLAGAPDLAC